MPTTMTQQQPQTNQYELQRQKIRDEEARRRNEEQAALQRRLAGRGFTAGSGYTESQQAQAETAARQGERSRLTDVDIAEAGADEQRAENERQRQWQSGEAEKVRTWQTGESQATRGWQTSERVGQQEWQAGQNAEVRRLEARRLTNEEKIQARQMGLAEDQFAEQKLQNIREYGLSIEDMNQRQQQLDDAAAQAQSQLDFNYWAQEAGYTENERERAWQERQATTAYGRQQETTLQAQNFQMGLAEYSELLTRGRMELEDTINRDNAALKMRADSLYNMGLSGAKVDTKNLSKIEIDAYNMGLAGKAKNDYDFSIQDQIQRRNMTIITSISDEKTRKAVQDLWDSFQIGG